MPIDENTTRDPAVSAGMLTDVLNNVAVAIQGVLHLLLNLFYLVLSIVCLTLLVLLFLWFGLTLGTLENLEPGKKNMILAATTDMERADDSTTNAADSGTWPLPAGPGHANTLHVPASKWEPRGQSWVGHGTVVLTGIFGVTIVAHVFFTFWWGLELMDKGKPFSQAIFLSAIHFAVFITLVSGLYLIVAGLCLVISACRRRFGRTSGSSSVETPGDKEPQLEEEQEHLKSTLH